MTSVRNECDEWNTCAVEWPSAPAWIPKPPRDHLHSAVSTSNATSVAHLLLLLPSPIPLPPPCRIFPIPFPKAISHRRTLAPSLQPGTLCRVAYDTEGEGGERSWAYSSHCSDISDPLLASACLQPLSKDGSETRRSFFSLCGPKSADACDSCIRELLHTNIRVRGFHTRGCIRVIIRYES